MQQSAQTEDLFERMPVSKAVFKLAMPAVLTSLITILYNLADTYFVGILNQPTANAAVTLAGTVTLAFNAVNNLFGVGTSSLMSRALGAKNYEKVRYASAFGVYSSLLCSVLFSVFSFAFMQPLVTLLGADSATRPETIAYLNWTVVLGAVPAIMNMVLSFLIRAEGQAVHASIGLISGCLINIVLDPIFILPWGLNMGAAGAGCATFIGNCFSVGYFIAIILFRRKKTYVSLNPKMIRFRKDIFIGVFSVGIPAAIQNLLNVTGTGIFNSAAASFGAEAVAAMGIAQKIHGIPQQITMGIPTGAMPLIGYNFAGRNGKRMRDVLFHTVKLMAAVLLLPTVICIAFPESVISLFIENEEIVDIGGKLLRIISFGVPLLCADFLAVNIFQAVGQGRNSLLFAVVRKVILEIPCILLFNRLLPLYGLAYAQPVTEFVMMILAVISIRSIVRSVGVKSS